jgi:hypothetical protein
MRDHENTKAYDPRANMAAPSDACAQPMGMIGRAPRDHVKDDIENNFRYHAPTAEMLPKFRVLRDQLRSAAHTVRELVPYGREQQLAITKLEEAMMFANAGIARQGPVAE